MGILNTTPDSFSDGGRYLDRARAVEHGMRLAAEGADIVDVGGESTRPGAARVPEDLELERVIPVVADLTAAGIRVSVDTMRSGVATAAVAAGAGMINDVSGGLADEAMADVVRAAGVPYVLTHWRGHSDVMQRAATYADVVAEVRDELLQRRDALVSSGVERNQIVLDPGIGFAKESEHSWALLGALHELRGLGCPLLVGASRKSLLGDLQTSTAELDVREKDLATAVLSALLAPHARYLRVHDVPSTVLALGVYERVARRVDR